jgi:hypothetical protein
MIIHKEAKDTITAVEMNIGDTLQFKLRNGQIRRLTLEETSAKVLLTNRGESGKGPGATLYHFACRVIVDDHPMTMERYVGSQESFYEPHVINGMRIWFDGVSDIFDFLLEVHGSCKPHKKARFAFNDVTDPICPQELKPWCPASNCYLDIGDCYDGDDCWMGAFHGTEAHGGLDINHPKGTPLWAPIDFDDQYLFGSVASGDNNNRWRGIRKWPDGTTWMLETAHIVRLLVPEHKPLQAGTHYAEAAGVWVWSHEHSHFAFKIVVDETEIPLDPWIIFWQVFENVKERAGDIKADMSPLGPAQTGQQIKFSGKGSRLGEDGNQLNYYWTFGDGGWSDDPCPTHTYLKSGIYPVTLIVDDGRNRDSYTQHITIDGDPLDKPGLALDGTDDFSFRPRPTHIMDVYGWPIKFIPHTLEYVARPTRPIPDAKTVTVRNIGNGALDRVEYSTKYLEGSGWVKIFAGDSADHQSLQVAVDGSGMEPGEYSAIVTVSCPGAINSPQRFRVKLTVPIVHRQFVVIDDRDREFYCTPYFWVGHRFRLWWDKRGYAGFCLTNGGRPREGEYARFTPDLCYTGKYEVSFTKETPFESGTGFWIRVHHKHGDKKLWVEPHKSASIGVFDFDEGTDGFVEILANGSRGQVLADAMIFRKLAE